MITSTQLTLQMLSAFLLISPILERSQIQQWTGLTFGACETITVLAYGEVDVFEAPRREAVVVLTSHLLHG